MTYVRCVNNKSYLHSKEGQQTQPLADLTVGNIYKALPISIRERDSGMLRVVDNSGEDYLYPTSYFEAVEVNGHAAPLDTLTIHLDPLIKSILRAEAVAARTSMSDLVRRWISQRLENNESKTPSPPAMHAQ